MTWRSEDIEVDGRVLHAEEGTYKDPRGLSWPRTHVVLHGGSCDGGDLVIGRLHNGTSPEDHWGRLIFGGDGTVEGAVRKVFEAWVRFESGCGRTVERAS